MFRVSLIFLFQTSYSTGSPVDRFQPSSFDVSVCAPSTMATDINTYQASYQSTTPMTSFTDTASFSGDTQMGESSPFFDPIPAASSQQAPTSSTATGGSQLQGFGDSPSPIQSLGETYNIHGTYTYLRDDGKAGDLISAFRDENTCGTPAPTPGSPQDTKFSNTSLFHYGQAAYTQAFPDDVSFMKQQGNFAVDNPEYYTNKQQQQLPQPQQPNPQQQHPTSSGSTGFPSPGPSDFPYPPDQKDVVFQNLTGFQGAQTPSSLFGDRPGYQSYQPGFYDNQRLTDSNFNFQLPHAGMFRDGAGVSVHGRGPYQRRGSLTNPERYTFCFFPWCLHNILLCRCSLIHNKSISTISSTPQTFLPK